eukprot:GHVQ01039315.1.p1 GENE.GHVQ01039315.1~~GHVQ01039315.1.p1  ORF type:complete len:821 (+),score=163.86 GHVQ01039315.1:403-2865(+)
MGRYRSKFGLGLLALYGLCGNVAAGPLREALDAAGDKFGTALSTGVDTLISEDEKAAAFMQDALENAVESVERFMDETPPLVDQFVQKAEAAVSDTKIGAVGSVIETAVKDLEEELAAAEEVADLVLDLKEAQSFVDDVTAGLHAEVVLNKFESVKDETLAEVGDAWTDAVAAATQTWESASEKAQSATEKAQSALEAVTSGSPITPPTVVEDVAAGLNPEEVLNKLESVKEETLAEVGEAWTDAVAVATQSWESASEKAQSATEKAQSALETVTSGTPITPPAILSGLSLNHRQLLPTLSQMLQTSDGATDAALNPAKAIDAINRIAAAATESDLNIRNGMSDIKADMSESFAVRNGDHLKRAVENFGSLAQEAVSDAGSLIGSNTDRVTDGLNEGSGSLVTGNTRVVDAAETAVKEWISKKQDRKTKYNDARARVQEVLRDGLTSAAEEIIPAAVELEAEQLALLNEMAQTVDAATEDAVEQAVTTLEDAKAAVTEAMESVVQSGEDLLAVDEPVKVEEAMPSVFELFDTPAQVDAVRETRPIIDEVSAMLEGLSAERGGMSLAAVGDFMDNFEENVSGVFGDVDLGQLDLGELTDGLMELRRGEKKSVAHPDWLVQLTGSEQSAGQSEEDDDAEQRSLRSSVSAAALRSLGKKNKSDKHDMKRVTLLGAPADKKHFVSETIYKLAPLKKGGPMKKSHRLNGPPPPPPHFEQVKHYEHVHHYDEPMHYEHPSHFEQHIHPSQSYEESQPVYMDVNSKFGKRAMMYQKLSDKYFQKEVEHEQKYRKFVQQKLAEKSAERKYRRKDQVKDKGFFPLERHM